MKSVFNRTTCELPDLGWLSVGFAMLCVVGTSGLAQAAPDAEEFPYGIQTELGATEFAPEDSIVITSLRGDRQHLEPGGRYLLEGSYTLASAENADLALFSTSRGPSGSTPVADDQHVKISKGSGTFRLKKTLSDNGWLHISFYVDNHSHGGVYFGERGNEDGVLRKKGWSDFSSDSTAHGIPSAATSEVRTITPEESNRAIMAYLGDPVPAPAALDAKYTPTNLVTAFATMAQQSGWQIKKLAVDDSEFPFLLYGLLDGRHELNVEDIRKIGYEYGGSVRGNTVKTPLTSL